MGSKTRKDPYTMIQDAVRQDIGYGTPFYAQDLGRAITCRPGFNAFGHTGMSLEDYADELVKYGALGLLKNDGDYKVYVLLKPDKRGKRVCYEAAVVKQ
jgi:hypothetical protein